VAITKQYMLINDGDRNADFEKAAHNAVLQIFPRCEIFGCLTFHLGKIGSGKYNKIKYYYLST